MFRQAAVCTIMAHNSRPLSRVLSGTVIPLGAALPLRSSNLAGYDASHIMAPCLVLLRMGFSLPQSVAACAVRSYRTFSPLPVPCGHGHRRFCSLFHFPSPHDARPLAGILLCGARTFLPAASPARRLSVRLLCANQCNRIRP